MKRTCRNFVLLAIVFLSASALGQVSTKQDRLRISVPWPVARLGFQSDVPGNPMVLSYPQVCMALHQDGSYRLLRRSSTGITEMLQGSLSVEQQKTLSELLSLAQKEESTGGALLRHDAEFLRMELPREKKAERSSSTTHREVIPLDIPEDKVRWYWVSEPDGETVFQPSVQNIVNWLQQFKADEATNIEFSVQDVCPGAEMKPLQPVAAH